MHVAAAGLGCQQHEDEGGRGRLRGGEASLAGQILRTEQQRSFDELAPAGALEPAERDNPLREKVRSNI